MTINGLLTMIGLSTLASGFTDDAFYTNANIRDTVMDSLDGVEAPFCLFVTGPKTFNPAINKKFPVFAAWKINSRDNRVFHPASQGQIVLSSLETGALVVTPLVDNSHKMPLYKGEEAEPVAPKPVDHNDVSYSYSYHDRDLKDFPVEAGAVAAVVLCGNIMSNVHIFTIESANPVHPAPVSPSRVTIPDGEKYVYTKTPHSPPLPNARGVAVKIEKTPVQSGRPCMLNGSFRFDEKRQGPQDVRIHLLIVADASGDPRHFEVVVPADMVTYQDGEVSGYFMVDLMKVFFYHPDVRFDIPAEVFVTAVRGGSFSGPVRIVLTK